MAQDLMQYDRLTQNALRQVIRAALERVAEDGLPGAHHFYITFQTRFPGVDIDEQLAKKYPEEITIVLENQYWDLVVTDIDFEVTLKFSGVPKYLKVPYLAVSRFHDPSVGFALQFESQFADPALQFPADSDGGTRAGPKVQDITPATPKKADKVPDETPEPETPPSGDGNIVSLDSFRKK